MPIQPPAPTSSGARTLLIACSLPTSHPLPCLALQCRRFAPCGGTRVKVALTLRDHLDRAVTVYPDRVAVVDEPDQPADSWGSLSYAPAGRAGPPAGRRARRHGRRARRPGGHGVAQRRPAVRQLLRRVELGPRLRAHQLPAQRRGDQVHRRPLRGRRAAGRPRAGGIPQGRRRPLQVHDGVGLRSGPLPARHRAPALGAGRGRHRGHQLHLRHHRPAQGRRADPPLAVGQLGHVRLAGRGQRPRHVPAHAAHVPLQRLGHALRHHGDGLHQRGAAQGGRAPRSCAGSSATG